jgi:hypothetical protein
VDIKIREDVLARTTECIKNFCCLDPNNRDLCKISSADGPEVLFIESEAAKSCHYKLSFGRGYICMCPARFHLYVNGQI